VAFSAISEAPKAWVVAGLGSEAGMDAEPKTCVVEGEGAGGGTETAPKTWVVVAGELRGTCGAPNTWVLLGEGGGGLPDAAPVAGGGVGLAAAAGVGSVDAVLPKTRVVVAADLRSGACGGATAGLPKIRVVFEEEVREGSACREAPPCGP
jgi:hypothetical protein